MPIIAIGGGEMQLGETLPIDKYIVERTRAQWPNALFIPTASSDAEDYVQIFSDIYGGQLGCTVNVLRLLQNAPPQEHVAELIRSADLTYVGGGNYSPDNWDYIRVKCLGMLPFTGCPHYDGEGRDQSFQTMIAKEGGIGIAIDDCAAFEAEGDQFRILSARPGAGAYRVERVRGQIVQTPIPTDPDFHPLASLHHRE